MNHKRILFLLSLIFFPLLSVNLMAAAAASGTFDWSRAKELYPGIRHAALAETRPRLMKLQVVRIDLKTPRLAFRTSGRAEAWGEALPGTTHNLRIRTERVRTSRFLAAARKKYDMVLAVNASPWRPWEKPFNHRYADDLGLAIADGQLVSPPLAGRPSWVIYRDRTMRMMTTVPEAEYKKIAAAVSGFAVVLRNNTVCVQDKSLHPRTFYGLSADRRYFYILVVDGRQKDYSLGMTTTEGAQYLQHLGAADGMNMDGGGSTTLAVFDRADGKVKLLNHQKGGVERSVANSLGVYYEK